MDAGAVAARRATALEALRRLEDAYGRPPFVPRREPMHELVSTILSQRTTMQAEAAAFDALWARYGSWDAIAAADEEALAATIARVTFPEPKARNIKLALARIRAERGGWDLAFLRDLPLDEAMAWLTSLPGVGVKTASLVLLFCFARPVLPVDTHVHRVSGRLGVLDEGVSAVRAHRVLLDVLPPEPETLFRYHVGLLRHGQRVCVFRAPRCARCPLRDLCAWYARQRAEDPAGGDRDVGSG